MRRAQFALLAALLASHARADDGDPTAPPTPFDRGRIGLSAGGGTQTALDHTYVVLGAAFGYFVLDGLELSLGGVEAFGDGPNIAKLTPEVRYVARPLVGRWPLIPYVASFYTHWFVGGGIPDVNTAGARGGLLYVQDRIILGLGLAYEHVLDEGCVTNCDSFYPDVTLGFSF